MMQSKLKKFLWAGLILTWISHFIGVLTPEIGFDAVWYHLPVVQAIVEQGRLVYLPKLYQSVNPLLSDVVFALGYYLAGELGTKIIAYLFALSLIFACYQLSRLFLNKLWSLWSILIISTFQVVAWQSSSFYVDVAKASWEVWSLFFLISWYQEQRDFLATQGTRKKMKLKSWLKFLLSALFFGASLGTKLFSLLLWPAIVLFVFIFNQTLKNNWLKSLGTTISYLFLSILPALPFYWFAYQKTGHPFYSFKIHLQQLGKIGESTSLWSHILQRSLKLYQFPQKLLFSQDYTSIILLIFLPLFLLNLKQFWKRKSLKGLLIFLVWQLLIWWYLPPLSSRYALSGFIVWLILVLILMQNKTRSNKNYFWPMTLTLMMAVMLNLAPRLYVNYRSWRYLAGQQTKEEYLKQFLDGNLDQPLRNWHQF